ncbi:MAG: hypothetical protein KGI46_00715 [Alphaproteobacteria bacterium]|nr:hypothetical protein [Alphaproteobacteria bacterium]
MLHPDKGIALVDTVDAAPAIAPLDDFLWHTGFAALQDDALCIVAVTITATMSDTVADQINAAFGGSPCGLANPNWCEAIVDLLLATPDLMLARLRPSEAAPTPEAIVVPVALSGDEIRQPHGESPPPMTLAAPVREHRPVTPESVPPPAWRSWPISPVAAAMALLALGAVALVSHQASPPIAEITNTPPTAHVASAATPATPATPVATVPVPSTMAVLPPPPVSAPTRVPGNGASVEIPSVQTATIAQPKPISPRPSVEHQVRRPVTPVAPARRTPQVASANTTRAVCADVFHPDLPGGWKYHGTPVPQCLPIRFFGLIGMR